MEVYAPDGGFRDYPLGPHTPRLRREDVELMHKLWLDLTVDPKFAGAHHYDVVALALEELQRDLQTEKRGEILEKFAQKLHKGQDPQL
jgi:hypothetical protein